MAFIGRFQIPVYFAVTLIVGWFPWYAQGDPSWLFFAPFVAALVVAPLVGGRPLLVDVLRQAVRWRGPAAAWSMALLGPGVIAVVAIGIHVLLGGAPPEFPLLTEHIEALPTYVLIFFLPVGSGNLAELGFRGYALPRLQKRWGPAVGTLILGAFFGAWQLPEFFDADSPQTMMGGVRFYPLFVLTEIGLSVMMTWVYNKTNQSSLIAGYILHSTANLWTVALLVGMTAVDGQLAFGNFDARLFQINAVVFALAAVIMVVATKGRLGLTEDD